MLTALNDQGELGRISRLHAPLSRGCGRRSTCLLPAREFSLDGGLTCPGAGPCGGAAVMDGRPGTQPGICGGGPKKGRPGPRLTQLDNPKRPCVILFYI